MAINGGGQYIGYMGSRLPQEGTLLSNTVGVPSYDRSSNVTYRFAKRQPNAHRERGFVIYLNGEQTDFGNINHLPLYWIDEATPTTFVTYTDEADRLAETNQGSIYGFQSDNSSWWVRVKFQDTQGSYWYWIPLIIGFPASSGTFAFDGDTWDIYELVRPAGEVKSTYEAAKNTTVKDLAGLFELCFDGNSRHWGSSAPWSYDNLFRLEPYEPILYPDIHDRTEMNSRTAGEKAAFEDEFITASQVEAGIGVTIRWRNIDGSQTDEPLLYPLEAAKGLNLIIEWGGMELSHGRLTGPVLEFPNIYEHLFQDTPNIRFIVGSNTDDDTPGNVGIIEAYPIIPARSPSLDGNIITGPINPATYEFADPEVVKGIIFSKQYIDDIFPYQDNPGLPTYSGYNHFYNWRFLPVMFDERVYGDTHVLRGVVNGNKVNVRLWPFEVSLPSTIDSLDAVNGEPDQIGNPYTTGGPYENALRDNTQIIIFDRDQFDSQFVDINPDSEADVISDDQYPADERRHGAMFRVKPELLRPEPRAFRTEWATVDGSAEAPLSGFPGIGNPLIGLYPYAPVLLCEGPILESYNLDELYQDLYGDWFRPERAGCYQFALRTHGKHLNNAAPYPLARYDHGLFLIKRTRGETTFRAEKFLDVQTWVDYNLNLATVIDMGAATTVLDSVPWSLHGSGQVWIAADEEVSAIRMLKGFGPWNVAQSRIFYQKHSYFDAHWLHNDESLYNYTNFSSRWEGAPADQWFTYTIT